MTDLGDVVADDLLGINGGQEREEPVKMVEFVDEKERSKEEKKFLTASAFMEEVIAGKRRLKLEENLDLNLLKEKAALKVQGTNEIRELFRVICEIPENQVKLN